ncbi:hypothetical protein [Niastella sp. OAS944]|uniref:hypothetical protein n=1 Tax=Niastella sp. OAS944 TaxID=2664089 RepID=UPI00349038A8|nr:hypothetical protein [Chitinophagaceae bacterium OAS944]
MTLEKLKEMIRNKTFRSNDQGFRYRFIEETTLQVNGRLVDSVQYRLEEQDGQFILEHNSLLGTEPLIVELFTEKPVTLVLNKKLSRKYVGTWVEMTDDY